MSDVRIIKDTVNHNGIMNEIEDLLKRYPILNNKKQISLQSNKKNPDPLREWDVANGKVKLLPGSEEEFIHPIFDVPLINHYMTSLNLYRTRIMINEPKECLTIHYDRTPRIHIPIKTNPYCLMIIDTTAYHLEAGKIYYTDTRKMHSAMNGSYESRMHIVGCTKPLE